MQSTSQCKYMMQIARVFSLMMLASVANAQLTDVFPLTKGLRYKYDFKRSGDTWTEWGSWSGTDSGVVSYQVLDSTRLNDTTVAWTIRQKTEVTRRWSRPDSTFFVNDSLTFALWEFLSGSHELRTPARTAWIWDFPMLSNIPVFRFSDSLATRRFHRSPYSCYSYAVPTSDSLWFSRDSGLVRRAYSLCTQNGESGELDRRFSKLLTRILLSADEHKQLPPQFRLFQNYPNPFNPGTEIRYQMPSASHVTLKVFDLIGREVATLVDDMKQPGTHTVTWDASAFASGVYLSRLQAGNFVETKRLMIIR